MIEKPIGEVFAYTADFSNVADWDPGVSEASQVGGGPIGKGTLFNVTAKFGASEIPMVYEITEYEAEHKVVLVGTSDTLDAVDEIIFSERPAGTVVEYIADLTFKNWFRHVAPLARPLMNRVGERALDGLVETLGQ